MVFSAAIVGLGNIGMEYDFDLPRETYALSHARAFEMHGGFRLLGGVDSTPIQRSRFCERYHCPAFSSVACLLRELAPDVIAVATPTETHLQVVTEIFLNGSPKAIICEKPLSHTTADAQRIADLCAKNGTVLFVNYMRRAEPGVRKVKELISASMIRMPFKAVVWYSKGAIHSGSHFLDLLIFWFGHVREMQLISRGRACEFSDAEPDFLVSFDCGTAVFLAADEDCFSHYTVEVVAANGRLRYDTGGVIVWQESVISPLDCRKRVLGSTVDHIVGDMNRYQHHVADALYRGISDGHSELCDAATGVETIRLLEGLLNSRNVEGK